MWKDILRRRWISIKNHPEFCVVKIAVIVGIVLLTRGSFFLCFISSFSILMIGMCVKSEDYLLPLSDREHKLRRVEESIFLSALYPLVFLIHNLIFIFILKEPFSVENAEFLLLLNLFVFVLGVGFGISIGSPSQKKKKSVLWKIFDYLGDIMAGMLFGQVFDLICLHGALYGKTHIFFLNPDWYVGTVLVMLIVEVIEIVINYEKLEKLDYARDIVAKIVK